MEYMKNTPVYWRNTLIMLGGILVLAGFAYAFRADHIGSIVLRLWLPLWAVTCLAYGLTSIPLRFIRRGVSKARGQLAEHGGGFYGAVALALFVVMEGLRIWQQCIAFMESTDPWQEQLVSALIPFSIDALMNTVYAAAWPAFAGKVLGGNFWWAMGPAFGIYWCARELMRRDGKTTLSQPANNETLTPM